MIQDPDFILLVTKTKTGWSNLSKDTYMFPDL